jgi:putative transposase
MPDYRRCYVPGGTYFFTLTTEDRRPILTTDTARPLLRKAFEEVQAEHAFEVTAIVLLPDHLHAIWTMPEGDADYSGRWALIKSNFTRAFLPHGGHEARRSRSRAKHRERSVWQRRFWEHV